MKCLGQNVAKPAFHIAVAVVRYESVVSKVTGAEYTAHNLGDIDDASQLAILSADPITYARRALQSFKALFEFFGSPWWTRPMLVKRAVLATAAKNSACRADEGFSRMESSFIVRPDACASPTLVPCMRL
jgi:hypothetical protein